MTHEAGEGEEVQARKGGGEPFIGAGQATEARGPGEVALHHPAAREEDKAVLGLGQLDDFEAEAMLRCSVSRSVAGVALINVAQLNVLASHLLDGGSQLSDLGALLLVGRGHDEREQVAQRIDSGMHLRAPTSFVSVVASTAAALRR